MRANQIKVDHWYKTFLGIGQCVDNGKRFPKAFKFNIVGPLPRGIVLLPPREVLHEVPAPGADSSHRVTKPGE